MQMQTYLFFRKDPKTGEQFFYPVQLADDADALRNVEGNPGTVKVEDMHGRVVYPAAVH
jgi:hypothetical protein